MAGLAIAGAAVFGPTVAGSELLSDDWGNASSALHLGYGGAVSDGFEELGSKPLLALLLPLPYALFGFDPEIHMGIAVGLAIASAACLFALLRTLRIERGAAFLIALLALLFPWADSTRIWATGGINNVAVCLYLLGAIVAIRGLRTTGPPSAGRHACAVALYVASVLTYEVAALLALVTGALYLGEAPVRRALRRWTADLVGVGAALVYTAETTVKEVRPLGDQLAHVDQMVHAGLSLAGEALVPLVVPPQVSGVAAAAVLGAACLVALRRGAEDTHRADLRRWLVIAIAAIVATAAAYAIFLPAAYWTPRSRGLENRVNVLAALPIATFVYAIVMLAALLAIRRMRRPVRLAHAATAAVTLLIAAGYVVELRDSAADYERAHSAERAVLDAIARSVGTPPSRTTLLTFGAPAAVKDRLPVFYDTWDLQTAVRVRFRDLTLEAYPVIHGASIRCEVGHLVTGYLPSPSPQGPLDPADNQQSRYFPYGSVIAIDVRAAVAEAIDDRRSCRRVLSRFEPGPVWLQ